MPGPCERIELQQHDKGGEKATRVDDGRDPDAHLVWYEVHGRHVDEERPLRSVNAADISCLREPATRCVRGRLIAEFTKQIRFPHPVLPPREIGACSGCAAAITWIRVVKGRRLLFIDRKVV
jgi:hypothetical protein